jgi:hypothetical protein
MLLTKTDHKSQTRHLLQIPLVEVNHHNQLSHSSRMSFTKTNCRTRHRGGPKNNLDLWKKEQISGILFF